MTSLLSFAFASVAVSCAASEKSSLNQRGTTKADSQEDMGLFNASLEPDMAYLVNLRRGWTDTFSFPIVLKEARDGQGELENFSKAFLGGKFIYINPSNKGQGNHEYIHQTFRVRLVPRDGDVTLYRCRLGSGEYFISNQKDCESINTGLLVANDGVLG